MIICDLTRLGNLGKLSRSPRTASHIDDSKGNLPDRPDVLAEHLEQWETLLSDFWSVLCS